MKRKAVVLLSGGLDSSVNLAAAVRDHEVVLCLTFDYGQRAASKEIESAKRLSSHYKVPHKIVELPWFKEFHSALSASEDIKKLPLANQISIDDIVVSKKTAKAVWVPNRNGVFLNIAAAYAENLKADIVIPGFNAEEALTFSDNSYDFLRNLRKSFSFSTANQVDVQCYTITMNKVELVQLGQKLQLPWELLWPCYQSLDLWCGECESCQRAKRAFKATKTDILFKFLKQN